jgi:hypothetical protein
MIQSIGFETPEPAPVGRRARMMLAIVATLVLLGFVAVIEIGALAMLTVVSSVTNHR